MVMRSELAAELGADSAALAVDGILPLQAEKNSKHSTTNDNFAWRTFKRHL